MEAYGRRPRGAEGGSMDAELDALTLEGIGALDAELAESGSAPACAAELGSGSAVATLHESDGDSEELSENEEDMHAVGIPAARGWYLDPRTFDTPAFRAKVLAMLSEELALEGWASRDVPAPLLPLDQAHLRVKRISGALTNAVFFVSYAAPGAAPRSTPPTVLLRVYGFASEALLSRREELLILHTLSSLYEIGPHIMGTFANGRVEEFYQCEPLSRADLRDFGDASAEGTAQWIARRMRELHEVPLDMMRTVLEQGDVKATSGSGFGRGIANHIMSASHPPWRKSRAAEGTRMKGYSHFAHPSPRPFASHANSSTMSFDSLATSYDSVASFCLSPTQGVGEQLLREEEAGGLSMSPLALGPATAPVCESKPYPGVWRRIKRWTREASKVVEMVNAFGMTQEGKVVTEALGIPNGLPVTVQEEAAAAACRVTAASLAAPRESLVGTMQALLALDLPQLCLEMSRYKQWVRQWEQREGRSRRVLCHNDSQYGNLLLLRVDDSGSLPAMAAGMPRGDANSSPRVRAVDSPSGRPRSRSRVRARAPHERLVVIDFEYATANPRAYDIANHFHEWRANYHDLQSPWALSHGDYPSAAERVRWLRAYVEQGRALRRFAPEKIGHSEPHPPDMLLPPSALDSGGLGVRRTSGQDGESDAGGSRAGQRRRGAAGGQDGDVRGGGQWRAAPLRRTVGERCDSMREAAIVREVARLEEEIHVWSPATHAVWGLWGIVVARERIGALLTDARACVVEKDDQLVYIPREHDTVCGEAGSAENFDNLRYALGRIELFRAELRKRGL
ncbi:choline kinase [Malassezia sp. CBS 17886]|nr:choline kinase [Malassezia sp. CBS 17886]